MNTPQFLKSAYIHGEGASHLYGMEDIINETVRKEILRNFNF